MIGPESLVGSLPLALAVGALAVAVVVAFVPGVPSGLLSLAGVLGYWWWSGTTSPDLLLLVALISLALVSIAIDTLAAPLAARAGGASARTILAATGVGIVTSLVAGPLGFIVGMAATVFALEYRSSADGGASVRAAAYATAGALASGVVQAILAAAILVGFVAGVVL